MNPYNTGLVPTSNTGYYSERLQTLPDRNRRLTAIRTGTGLVPTYNTGSYYSGRLQTPPDRRRRRRRRLIVIIIVVVLVIVVIGGFGYLGYRLSR